MGRPKRVDLGGYVYHVLNRGNGRMSVFDDPADFDAFERVLEEAAQREPGVGLLAYCLMPNHWHLVLRPTHDGELSRYVRWLTLTHTQRWHAHRQTFGGGHVYQGRYKSFLIQAEGHLATVCRYVERNPLRANLVERAEDWTWSSLYRWNAGSAKDRDLLAPWPVPGGRRPPNWLDRVNTPQTEAELEALRRSVNRGQPYGTPVWRDKTSSQFGLESTFRPQGRPRKEGENAKNGS